MRQFSSRCAHLRSSRECAVARRHATNRLLHVVTLALHCLCFNLSSQCRRHRRSASLCSQCSRARRRSVRTRRCKTLSSDNFSLQCLLLDNLRKELRRSKITSSTRSVTPPESSGETPISRSQTGLRNSGLPAEDTLRTFGLPAEDAGRDAALSASSAMSRSSPCTLSSELSQNVAERLSRGSPSKKLGRTFAPFPYDGALAAHLELGSPLRSSGGSPCAAATESSHSGLR